MTEYIKITREQILEILPKEQITAELGVGFGNFSEKICSITNSKEHHAIDIWQEINKTIQGTYFASNYDMDKRFDEVVKKLSKFPAKIYRDLSYNIKKYVTHKSLDWVYIDGDHTYDGCMKDLEAVDPLVKDDGFILGHDFCKPKNHQDWGVIESVNDFVQKNKYFLSVVTQEKFPTFIISKNLEKHEEIITKCKSIKIEIFEERFSKKHNRTFLWPKFDKVAWKTLHKKHEWNLPEIFTSFCDNKNIVIQAGGNAGLYPYLYSKFFKKVYTFEPDPLNYQCLQHNLKDCNNVIMNNVGLSDKFENVGLEYNDHWLDENCGAMHVTDGNDIQLITIDSLNLNPDLIHLDIEGYEAFALHGGLNTIRRSHPIIVLETNNSGEKYGWTQDKINEFLFVNGYMIYSTDYRDVIYKYKKTSGSR